jgi:hypothetical protein
MSLHHGSYQGYGKFASSGFSDTVSLSIYGLAYTDGETVMSIALGRPYFGIMSGRRTTRTSETDPPVDHRMNDLHIQDRLRAS